MMSDRAETEADFGTLPPQETLCLSGVSSWLPKRRGPVASLGDECFPPVLLLRILILRRLDTTTSAAGDTRWRDRDICVFTVCTEKNILVKSKY